MCGLVCGAPMATPMPSTSAGGAMPDAGMPAAPVVPSSHASHGVDALGGPPSKHAHGGGGKPHQSQSHGAHDKHVVQRTAPENRKRAKAILDASISMFGNTRANKFKPSRNAGGDHRQLTDAMKAEWTRRLPGLPVPGSVVIDQKTGRTQGAVFILRDGADLGMGTAHRHEGGRATMQHVWFTPGNMDLAFSDVSRKKQARAAANAR